MSMEQDNSTSILLRLSPEVYEVLEHFGAENQISVPSSACELFQQAFEQWRKGKISIEVTEKSRRYYKAGQTQRHGKGRRSQK